jgi:hypothetical protein
LFRFGLFFKLGVNLQGKVFNVIRWRKSTEESRYTSQKKSAQWEATISWDNAHVASAKTAACQKSREPID